MAWIYWVPITRLPNIRVPADEVEGSTPTLGSGVFFAGAPAPYPRSMIKLSVSYPSGDGTTFDHDYYAKAHVPMCNSTFSPTKTEIDKGIDGPSVAGVHFYFDSMESLQAAMGSPKMGEIIADVANYTNIAPVMQISEVVS